jgi:hypothetical protein
MGSRFQYRYPNKGRILFDGGLNNKFERSLIEDNESPDCANVIFTNGAVETRGGTTLFNTSSVGSFICDGLFTRHDDNTDAQTMVAWWDGSLHVVSGTTFATIASAASIFTAGVQVTATEYENYMFFGNGNSTPYKYGGDGNTFTRHGIPQPTSAPTLTTAGTGTALTGDYQYKVTYVNSALVEGDVTAATPTFTVAGENIAVNSLPIAPQSFGVNSRKIYRTENGGSTFKLLTTINDNTTTSYEDAIADSGLGATAPTDQGVPPNYSMVIYHNGRLFAIDPSDQLVKYSEYGNPYVFKATSFLRIGDTSGDIPKSLSIYDNSVVVHCEDSQWIIYLDDPASDTNWQIVKVRASYGSMSPFGAVSFQNRVLFPATQNKKFVGFGAIAGDTLDPSATLLTVSAAGSDLQSDRIQPDMFLIQEGHLGKIQSIVYQNKAYISVVYGTGNTTNNRFYIYDFSISNISKRQKFSWVPWTGLNASHMTIYDGTLYYADAAATGRVFEMNTDTYNDNGSAIDSYYWTKEYAGLGGHENLHKDFRFAQIFYEKAGDYFMNFTVRVDSDSGSGDTSSIDLDPDSSLWGSMKWGTDTWGGGQDEGEIRKFISPARGKRIQYKFSNQNTLNQKFKIVGMNFVYINKGER